MERMYQSGATFYQTPSLSVLSQCDIPAWCITKVIAVDTGIVLAWGTSHACISPRTERFCAPEGGYPAVPAEGVMPIPAEGDLMHPVCPAKALQDALTGTAEASTVVKTEPPAESNRDTKEAKMEVSQEECIVLDTKEEIDDSGSVGPVENRDPYDWEQEIDWGDEVEGVAVPATAFNKDDPWKDKALPVDDKPDVEPDLGEPQILICPFCYSNFSHHNIWCPSCRRMVIQDTQAIQEYILERMRSEVQTIAQRELWGLEFQKTQGIAAAIRKKLRQLKDKW